MSRIVANRRYFEGWYFKHQIGNYVIAFVPGIHIGKDGKKNSFIQIITNDNSYNIIFPYDHCKFNRRNCYVKIGENIFSKRGIKVNLHTPDIQIVGKIKYGNLDRIRYCIMGYYRYLPFMECKHEVISMRHSLKGYLNIFNKKIELTKGSGYIEKDWGHSFPSRYFWLQSNSFIGDNASVMLSIARIPYLGFQFEGCICVIHYNGREYRFTTYLGVKINAATETEVYLKQGKYKLYIFMDSDILELSKGVNAENKRKFGYQLNAPARGDMNRPIKEDHLCVGRLILFNDHQKIFDLRSDDISMEYVE